MLHLQMYCETMAPYAGNEPLLIMIFQESLSGHVAAWFLQLEEITYWKGLENAFLAQYHFNTESVPDCLDLQRMERESKEALFPRIKEIQLTPIPMQMSVPQRRMKNPRKRVRLTGLSSIKKSLRKLIVVRGMHPRIWLRELSISRNNLLKWSSQCTS